MILSKGLEGMKHLQLPVSDDFSNFLMVSYLDAEYKLPRNKWSDEC